jgi:hypothetical protein
MPDATTMDGPKVTYGAAHHGIGRSAERAAW